METTAPTFPLPPRREERPPPTRKYPDPATNLGKAWAAAWAELSAASPEWLDGVELAKRSAPVSGLAAVTMVTLFTRAATAGVLERDHRPAPTTRGIRQRTFYRVPQA